MMFRKNGELVIGNIHLPNSKEDYSQNWDHVSEANRIAMTDWLANERILRDKTVVTLNIGVPGLIEPLLDLDHDDHSPNERVRIGVNYHALTGSQNTNGIYTDDHYFGIEWLKDYEDETDVIVMPFTSHAQQIDPGAFRSVILDPVLNLLKQDGLIITTSKSQAVIAGVEDTLKPTFKNEVDSNKMGGLHAFRMISIRN